MQHTEETTGSQTFSLVADSVNYNSNLSAIKKETAVNVIFLFFISINMLTYNRYINRIRNQWYKKCMSEIEMYI